MIGGLKNAQHMLEEVLSWPSLYPNFFSSSSLRLRSGILLYGPPGCGKTLLAQTVTKKYKLNYITVKVSCIFFVFFIIL